MSRRAAVFLDRDGTVNRELPHSIAKPEDIEILPGVAEGLALLVREGYQLVIVSNQSGIARGNLDHERLARVHAHLVSELAARGAPVALTLSCPHHESAGLPPYRRACGCRKPRPGMLAAAAVRLELELQRSWIFGDAERDLLAGQAVGARAVLVGTGKGAAERARLTACGNPPLHFAADLVDAARIVCGAS